MMLLPLLPPPPCVRLWRMTSVGYVVVVVVGGVVVVGVVVGGVVVVGIVFDDVPHNERAVVPGAAMRETL